MRVPVVGEQLGRYEITRRLGAGAMGEVFAAWDERLEREVAVKLLRPEFAEDFERRERFEREAKAIAALDHPNIVTIHSVEEDEGTHFLTMQLVEGTTLDEVVPEGGLAVDRFLDVALRLVEAVAAAHQRGIVHRDLKPSNVMVAEDGRLKVLDFGLAKLRTDVATHASLADPGTLGLTLEGQIIGTVAYMSPEQAEGRAADHRSDIFSLGVLLYEMATGQAPFRGDTPISVMSSIIKDTPSLVTQVKPGLPAHLSRIIRTCLAKDPVRRYQSAIDLRNALDDLKQELQSGEYDKARPFPTTPAPEPRAAPPPPATRRSLWVGLALAALVGGVGLGRLTAPEGVGGGESAGPNLVRLTSQAGLAGSPSWAPDGSEIVYASNEAGSMDLWHQEADGRAQRITDFLGSETDPDWAPDDSAVAYSRNFGNDGIDVISPHGGQSTRIAAVGARPRWSPDSTRLVYDWRGTVYVIDAQPGAEPTAVVPDTAGVPHPAWSHDGEYLYFWDRSRADVYRVGADGSGQQALGLVPTGQEVAGIAAARNGAFLVLSRGPYGGNKDLWKVPLNADGLPAGATVRLTQPTTDDVNPALSPDGVSLAYAARHVVRHLEAVELDLETGIATNRRRQLTVAADSNYYPAVSPDGTTLVFTAHRTSGQGLLYLLPIEGPVERKATSNWERTTREIGGSFSPSGVELLFTSTVNGSYELFQSCLQDCVPTRLTTTQHPVRDVMPSWSPGGDRIAFYSNRAGNWDIWSLTLGNGEEPERLTESLSHEMYPSFSPDGQRIVYWTDQDGGGGDIWVMDANGANRRAVVVDPAQEGWATWSPDGRWLYFTSDRSGSFNVWAIADSGGEPIQITHFSELDAGLPEAVIYTKFAVAGSWLIIPVEQRSGGLWLIEALP